MAERSEDPGRQGGRQGESAEGQGTEGQGKANKIHKIQVELGKVAFKAARATQGRGGGTAGGFETGELETAFDTARLHDGFGGDDERGRRGD